MAIRTDRFMVRDIRPAEHLHSSEVPEELKQRLQNRVITVRDLEELGATVETARLYHGGKSQAVVLWHGQEYEVYLEPVA